MKKILFSLLLSPCFLMAPEEMEAESLELTDTKLAAKRSAEDTALKQRYEQETAQQKKIRDQQSFGERLLKAASSDGAEDSSVSKIRNKEILEINRRRLEEDLARQKAKIDDFKKKHKAFAEKPGWKDLLELGDMKSFIDKTPEQREDFIETIKTSVESLTEEGATFEPSDKQALTYLINITMKSSSLKAGNFDTFVKEITTASDNELANLSDARKTGLTKALSEALKDSLHNQILELTKFNESTKNLNEDINSLAGTRRIKEISLKATLILGTVAAVFMFLHLPVEIPAIFAKVAFLVYHSATHSEDTKSTAIQNKFLDSMKTLMPETAEYLKAEVYKSTEESLSDRMDRGIKSTLGDTGNKVYEGMKKGFKFIGEHVGKAGKAINEGFHRHIKTSYKEGNSSAVVSDADFQEFNVAPAKPTAPENDQMPSGAN